MFNHNHSHTHGSASWNCSVHTTDEMRIFKNAVIGLVFLAGLVLNLTGLWVFYRQRSSWTDTHVYMINLALADSGLVVIMPVRLYESFLDQSAPRLCSARVILHYTNMYGSILTATAISVQRFLAVGYYFLAGDFRKELVPMRKNKRDTGHLLLSSDR